MQADAAVKDYMLLIDAKSVLEKKNIWRWIYRVSVALLNNKQFQFVTTCRVFSDFQKRRMTLLALANTQKLFLPC